MADLHVVAAPASLARAAAEHVVMLASEAIAACGQFTIALSGGSTPRATYVLLATDEFASRVDWGSVHVFWGDERCVPPDHPESNYRMAHDALLAHVPIPPENVHRVRAEMAPIQAADDYERTLRAFFAGQDAGRFDLVLLGLGGNGHTASLFPGTQALDERGRWVVASHVASLDAWRITLTPPILNAAAHVTFLVTGQDKAETLHRVLDGPRQPEVLPAQLIQPASGGLMWLVDEAAASLLG